MAIYNGSYYPHFGAEELRNQYGRRWTELVDWLRQLSSTDPQVMAFTLMMRRMRRDANLPAYIMKDPFNTLHAQAVLSHYKGSEEELLNTYYENLNQIHMSVNTMRVRGRARRHSVTVAA